MQAVRRAILLLACLALLGAGARVAHADEAPPPHQQVNAWYGPRSPFKFEDGPKGEKLVRIGRQVYLLITLNTLLSNPNLGLAHRNVAIAGEVGVWHDHLDQRSWDISLAENSKAVFGPPPGEYSVNVDMVRGLEFGDSVLLTGTAKVNEAGNGSLLMVDKPYRIPPELDRQKQLVDQIINTAPDYNLEKALADQLETEAQTASRNHDDHLADQFHDLKTKVVNDLISLRAAFLKNGGMSADDMYEYIETIRKYTPDDTSHMQEVLKIILQNFPDDKRNPEAVRGLLPDWTRCPANKIWMRSEDSDKLLAKIQADQEKVRLAEAKLNQEHLLQMAQLSTHRHTVEMQTQAMLNDNHGALPPADSTAWKQISDLLAKSDDFRLVQSLCLQAVAQLPTKDWVRIIQPLLQNDNEYVRLLAYRLGGYSQDLDTLLQLSDALRNDHTRLIKEDAVMAICETRSVATVRGLVACLLASTDDGLNAVLVRQLQSLTHRADSDKDAWQKYVADPAQIKIASE
ncbi:MAG: HEAT repeat domain-containing protein [Planctomycetota bacterium]